MTSSIISSSPRYYHDNAARRQAKSVGAGMVWHRGMSTLAYILGFGLIALVLHEFFHFVTLRALGGDGYITFSWGHGLTHLVDQPSHLWAVYLGGGLLTGVFFLVVFWIWAWSSRTVHNTNIEMAAFAWGLGSIAYAPTELLASNPTIGLIAFALGFGAGAAVYFTKLLNWLDSPPAKELVDPAAEGPAFSANPLPGQQSRHPALSGKSMSKNQISPP